MGFTHTAPHKLLALLAVGLQLLGKARLLWRFVYSAVLNLCRQATTHTREPKNYCNFTNIKKSVRIANIIDTKNIVAVNPPALSPSYSNIRHHKYIVIAIIIPYPTPFLRCQLPPSRGRGGRSLIRILGNS